MKRICIVIFGGVLSALSLSAQANATRPADQTFVLDTPPRAMVIPPQLIAPMLPGQPPPPPAPGNVIPPGNLNQGQVQSLLTAGLNLYGATILEDTDYMLHLVQHKDGTVGAIRDSWYVFSCGWLPKSGPCQMTHLGTLDRVNMPFYAEQFKRNRLFGTRKLSLVYIHYNVPVGTLPINNVPNPPVPFDRSVVRGPNGGTVTQIMGTTPAIYTEDGFLPIVYSIDVTKKTASIVDNLKTVLGQFGLAGAGTTQQLVSSYQALVGVKLDMQIEYRTSNITVAGQRGADRTNIGSKEFDNERRYWLDFGFAIPLSKIKELKLADGNAIVPRPVEKSNIYGTVSFFPLGAVDTKAEKAWFRAPQIMYGMALNNKPWDDHLFAIGFLTKYVQPFVGVTVVNKQARTPTATDTGLKWSTHLAYGIHVPASSIATFIKKAGGS